VGAGLTNSFRQVMLGSYLNPRHLLRCLAVGLSVGAPDNFPKDPGHTGEAASRTYPLGGFCPKQNVCNGPQITLVIQGRPSIDGARPRFDIVRTSRGNNRQIT